MATFLNGILGGFSGKVGTVIGSNWNGIDYMRSRAANITQPNTVAQLEQRARFGMAGKFLRPLIPFLRVSYRSLAVKKSAFNAAMAHTLENAVKGIYPDVMIDYTKVLVSQGTLLGAQNPDATSVIAGKVDFTWDDNSTEYGAAATDKVVVAVYSESLKKWLPIIGAATRVQSALTITLPEIFSGQEVQTYIGFSNADQSEFSNGEFLKPVLVA